MSFGWCQAARICLGPAQTLANLVRQGDAQLRRIDEIGQERREIRDFYRYRLPENIEVDVEIGMYEAVAHGDDFRPGNRGRRRTRFG